MNTSAKIRIMLVDDHPVVREGLAAILGRCADMEVIAAASNGEAAVAQWRQRRPDVTLMDLRMPEMDGIQAVAAVCHEFPSARFIVLTTFDGDEYIYRALQAGAKAYVLKDAPGEELLAAIRAVHGGRSVIPPAIAVKIAARVKMLELTPREREVLQCMTLGHSNQEIASELFVAESTVKSHVNSILGKMNVTDRTQAVTSAVKRGLVLLE